MTFVGVRVSSAATDLLELTEENVEKVLDEVSTMVLWEVTGSPQVPALCW